LEPEVNLSGVSPISLACVATASAKAPGGSTAAPQPMDFYHGILGSLTVRPWQLSGLED